MSATGSGSSQQPPPPRNGPPPPRVLPPPPQPVVLPEVQPAGWYADPWDATLDTSQWRWWDGHQWTGNTSPRVAAPVAAERKPRLPAWLSPPVLTAFVPSLLLAAITAVVFPWSIALGFAPLFLVGPALIWIDRVEPEPWSSRVHALLWGGLVAGLIGLVTNTAVAAAAGETWAAVVSAPFSEEIGKGLGVYWAIRRKEVDSVMDGLVYAGWVGLGFAIIEDFGYFAQAGESGELVTVFVGRALLTPFAHPLFTAWTGLALARAHVQGKPLITGLWGLVLAIGTHALWNGSLVLSGPTDSSPDGNVAVLGLTMFLFVGFFTLVCVATILLRRRDAQRFVQLIPTLAQRYGLPPSDIAQFGGRKQISSARKALPKSERKRFDRRHAAIARLAALQDHSGELDPSFEARLVSQVHEGVS